MGADIYLQSRYEATKAKHWDAYQKALQARNSAAQSGNVRGEKAAQKRADKYWDLLWHENHYYRDSYNRSNLLWTMDLSWWQDVGARLDGEQILSVEGCQWLLDTIQARMSEEVVAKAIEGLFGEEGVRVEGAKEEWREFYWEQFKRLSALLTDAIALGEGLYCSI